MTDEVRARINTLKEGMATLKTVSDVINETTSNFKRLFSL